MLWIFVGSARHGNTFSLFSFSFWGMVMVKGDRVLQGEDGCREMMDGWKWETGGMACLCMI